MQSLITSMENLLITPKSVKSPKAAGGGFFFSIRPVATSPFPGEKTVLPPLAVNELAIYREELPTAPGAPCGLGCIQPNGRDQVLQQWATFPAEPREKRQVPPRLPEPKSATTLLKSVAGTDRTEGQKASPHADLEWGSLSDGQRQAMRQWVAGELGGRHCMLVLTQGSSQDLMFGSPSEETSLLSDLRGGALNALTGLHPEVGLLSHPSTWLFEEVFGKSPQNLLEEALAAAVSEIADARTRRPADLSVEQANLALRRLAMKLQFDSLGLEGGDKLRRSEECTRLQVWLELLRLHTEGVGFARAAPRPPRPLGPSLPWHDFGVMKELGKAEAELEAESNQMSLDALRAQNRAIEEYVIRLVRQRDELKQIMKLTEERDSYFILGLSGPKASEEEVKKAYRNLARKEHPDKAGIGNKRRFQAIQQAYTSVLRQMRDGSNSDSITHGDCTPGDKKMTDDAACSASVQQAISFAREARAAADEVARAAHRTLRSNEDALELHAQPKRKALRCLCDLTRQGSEELRSAASHLRRLGTAVVATAHVAEAAIEQNHSATGSSLSSTGLRDRAVLVEDAGQSCIGSAELLEKISEATEATLKKVEKASPPDGDLGPSSGPSSGPSGLRSARNDEAANLLRLGSRLLGESLARTAAVGRRSADEAMSSAIKALELTRALIAMEQESRKDRERQNSKRRGFDDDAPVAAPDMEREGDARREAPDERSEERRRDPSGQAEPRPARRPESGTGDDKVETAARRVKERHVVLRVKNLRFLSSLNEEALLAQSQLRALLQRSHGALLPEVSVEEKKQLFELVSQLLDFAVLECGRLLGGEIKEGKVLERALSFAFALEFGKEIAMPADSRTQALKLAALVDGDLLTEVIDGPFRRRLLSLSLRKVEPLSGRPGGYLPPLPGRHARETERSERGREEAGRMPGGGKAWEESVNACCSRIAKSIRLELLPAA